MQPSHEKGFTLLHAHLSCKNADRVVLIGTAWFLGFFIGLFVFTPLSDKFGRRRPMLAAIFVYQLAVTAQVMLPAQPISQGNDQGVLGLWLFALCRAVLGLTNGALGTISFVSVIESARTESLRTVLSMLLHFYFGAGCAGFAFFAKSVGNNWRSCAWALFWMATGVHGLFALCAKESPKWLETSLARGGGKHQQSWRNLTSGTEQKIMTSEDWGGLYGIRSRLWKNFAHYSSGSGGPPRGGGVGFF